VSDTAQPPTPAADREPLRSEVRDGMRIDWDAPIVMDDDIILRADVFRPDDDGEYPVILSHGPYAKGLAFQEGYADQWKIMVREHPDVEAGSSNLYQSWEVADPEKWVPDGYACARVDSRGAGRSPGILDPLSAREARDMYDCIEWAGTQPWSNGKVGLAGISYYAINQWQVAGMQPPHLAAMCPWEGAADMYRDMSHHGGIFCTFFPNWYDKQLMDLGVQHGVGDRGPRSRVTGLTISGPETLSEDELADNREQFGQNLAEHSFDDEYHRGRSPDWSKVTAPLLSACNWGGQGLHSRGNFEGYLGAGSEQKWLEVHGLEHWTHFYTDYGVGLQKRFFGHFLKGEDTGWEDQPPVLLQVRHVDGSFTERGEQEWPLARTDWTRLHLDPDGWALRDESPREERTASYHGFGDGVRFSTPPVEAETEITGPVAAKLFVSSSTEDADLFCVLGVYGPDDEEVVFQGALDPHTPVAQGWLRVSHRKLDPERTLPYRPYHTHDAEELLTPGEVYEVDVEIWPTCVVVPAGYRVALTIRGRDYEYAGEPARLGSFKNAMTGCGPFLHEDPRDRPRERFGGTVTIHAGGDRDSHVLLPIVP
jgi:putative CocE/NonD family hydrolase